MIDSMRETLGEHQTEQQDKESYTIGVELDAGDMPLFAGHAELQRSPWEHPIK